MFSLRRHILMLKFLHSYPCLAMRSVTKCTEMWVFLSKSSYCNQLRLVVYPIIYRILYPRWLFGISEPSTVLSKSGQSQHKLRAKPKLREEDVIFVLRWNSTFKSQKPMGPLDISDIKLKIWDLEAGKTLDLVTVANVIPVLAII